MVVRLDGIKWLSSQKELSGCQVKRDQSMIKELSGCQAKMDHGVVRLNGGQSGLMSGEKGPNVSG